MIRDPNDNRPKKTLALTTEEEAEYESFKHLAHYDPETGVNTFDKYTAKLEAWGNKLRKKHKLDDKEAFFFHTQKKAPPEGGA